MAAMAGRAEIDTSAPFESVKEAVDHFGGGCAQWKSELKQLFEPERHQTAKEVEVIMVKEQAAQLEQDLIVKERETLDVLKELEMTKRIVVDLKLKLQKEASKVSQIPEIKVHPILETEEDSLCPGLILTELKQAKVNLNWTTSNLAGIRASVELLTYQIEKEKALLDKTRENLISNAALVSSLEEELDQTTLKLQQTKNLENGNPKTALHISEEIERLNSEIENFRKMKDASKSMVLKLTAEIEQTKGSIKTAEIRWFAAKKLEVAAKAAEAVAIAEIKALTNKHDYSADSFQTPPAIILSIEEYTELARKAQEADEISKKRIETAILEVEEANQSNLDLLTSVEKAEAEVKTSRKALEEALIRVEAANRGKLAVEDALRRWRSEQSQRRRYVQGSPKFKNTYYRRDSRMIDFNGLSLVTDMPSGTRPTLSIEQVLGKKLMGPEDYAMGIQEKISAKSKVSLGQMLRKKHGVLSPPRVVEDSSTPKKYSAKRKKFRLVGLSLSKAKQDKKAKEARSPKYLSDR